MDKEIGQKNKRTKKKKKPDSFYAIQITEFI